ncbi:hypothetical protein MMC25_001461 [Agyrium rufum]|nr:hypothetical protein [Agyrium rufum]
MRPARQTSSSSTSRSSSSIPSPTLPPEPLFYAQAQANNLDAIATSSYAQYLSTRIATLKQALLLTAVDITSLEQNVLETRKILHISIPCPRLSTLSHDDTDPLFPSFSPQGSIIQETIDGNSLHPPPLSIHINPSHHQIDTPLTSLSSFLTSTYTMQPPLGSGRPRQNNIPQLLTPTTSRASTLRNERTRLEVPLALRVAALESQKRFLSRTRRKLMTYNPVSPVTTDSDAPAERQRSPREERDLETGERSWLDDGNDDDSTTLVLRRSSSDYGDSDEDQEGEVEGRSDLLRFVAKLRGNCDRSRESQAERRYRGMEGTYGQAMVQVGKPVEKPSGNFF